MDPEFWLTRWAAGSIGFHLPQVNPRLLAHQAALPALPVAPSSAPRPRIFVPLCGKSLDLRWLAEQGYEVVGAELSELAVQAFFAESGATPHVEELPGARLYRAGHVAIFCGDVFALTPALLGPVHAFYDRAAVVALPPALRPRYAALVKALVPAGAVGLLVAFEYPQSDMAGPPFSVPRDEVKALFLPEFSVEELASYDILADEPRFRQGGLSALSERVYRLVRR